MSEATDRAEQFVIRGEFVLRSGGTTDYYVDRELVARDPKGAAQTIRALLEENRELQERAS